MEKLLNKIKDLNIKKAPSYIRGRIYRRILIIKSRPYLYTLSAIFIGTFLILGNHIYRNLLETESIAVIKVLAQDFEMSFDYFSNSFLSLNEILPKKEIVLLAVNFMAIIGLAEIFRRFKHELLKMNN
ncbi:MAG: hypothetical protein ACYC40_02315 [Patescibacteria group bacterium]